LLRDHTFIQRVGDSCGAVVAEQARLLADPSGPSAT
jgi:hypothetical protein